MVLHGDDLYQSTTTIRAVPASPPAVSAAEDCFATAAISPCTRLRKVRAGRRTPCITSTFIRRCGYDRPPTTRPQAHRSGREPAAPPRRRGEGRQALRWPIPVVVTTCRADLRAGTRRARCGRV